MIFFAIVILPLSDTLAQDVIIRGKVMDSEQDMTLPGAIIAVGDVVSVSDGDGGFELSVSPSSSPVVVSCTYVGYERERLRVELDRDTIDLVFELMPEDQVLNTMTVTAGRYDRRIGESIVSLEVIRPQLIENINTVSVDEVLQKMPGVDIVGGQANIRGGSGFSYGAGTRVLILLDDIPALQADAGFPNWNDFPVENIAQIEVLKGASSVLYGSSALNGIINIRTGYPTDTPVTKASTFYTHFMSPQDPAKRWWSTAPYQAGASLLHKQRFGKFDLVMSGFYRDTRSFNQEVYERYGRFTSNLLYRIHDRLTVGVNTNFNPGSNADFFFWLNAEEGAHQPSPDVINQSDRFRYNIDPHLTYFDKSGGRHKILSRYYYVDNNNTDNRSNTSSLYYGEYQYFKEWSDIGLIATGGIVAQHTASQAELYGDTTYTTQNFAGYIQLDQSLTDRLTVSGGMRYEFNRMRSPEEVGDFFIPSGEITESKPVLRFGMNYQAADYTFFRASYGEGYRFPTVAERFINTPLGPVSIIPNPDLVSETGWTAELGFKQGLRLGGWSGFFDAAVFWQEYDNMMEFVATIDPNLNFGFQSQNIGDTRIKGVDVNLNGAGRIMGLETTALIGYTFIDPTYRTFTEIDSLSSSARRNVLKYRFNHTFKFDVETGTDIWRVGLSIRYNSFMENIDAILEDIVVPGLKAYRAMNDTGFTIVDVRGSYRINSWLRVHLIANNILNKEFSLRPGLLEAPRNITCRLDFNIQ